MKRGWISWDQTELPRAAFDARLAVAREHLAQRNLPALVVYTDIWRSNRVRHFSNFMPYWNRALLVIPREDPPVLLCGLSPRVYPWIRSVTILEDILPSPNLAQRLLQLCSDNSWKRIGALDFAQFQHDLYVPLAGGGVEIVNVSLPSVPDDWELTMHRRAAKMARDILSEELPRSVGSLDYEFTGRLERRYRSAGAEDLVVLLTNGDTPPIPARSAVLSNDFSVALALEYRGHWIKIVRNAHGEPVSIPPAGAYLETLSGPYPFESGDSSLFAARWEVDSNGRRLFCGDTYWRGKNGTELL